MSTNVGEVELGTYEAELIRVATNRGNPLTDGAEWIFKLSNGEVMAFYSKPLNGRPSDTRGSLKLVTHFLDYPFTATNEYQISRLAGRFIRLTIERKIINGKKVPVIVGFAFSTRQLFACRTDRNAGDTAQGRSQH